MPMGFGTFDLLMWSVRDSYKEPDASWATFYMTTKPYMPSTAMKDIACIQ